MFKIKWTVEAEKLYFETLEYWINHNKSKLFFKNNCRGGKKREITF